MDMYENIPLSMLTKVNGIEFNSLKILTGTSFTSDYKVFEVRSYTLFKKLCVNLNRWQLNYTNYKIKETLL